METRARYALIGVFMLAVILASFAFVYWLENKGGFGKQDIYQVRFQGSVSGLSVGSAVLFNGLRVGEVTGSRSAPTGRKTWWPPSPSCTTRPFATTPKSRSRRKD